MTFAASPTDIRLPVTLLTGFLGAGKTTLLNSVLRAKAEPGIAVIVSEFGEAGLDHDLVEAVDEKIVLMQSGCLCCSVRADLARTMCCAAGSPGPRCRGHPHPAAVSGLQHSQGVTVRRRQSCALSMRSERHSPATGSRNRVLRIPDQHRKERT
ncbi:hypothetical protein AL035_20745 [Salipiger aestuarii]|nr:hypothetical protein AL037_20400 [Salipiger aestuarii]KAB2533448.1 hypothetical protein AL035_20745 [Salipiger aestuarii]